MEILPNRLAALRTDAGLSREAVAEHVGVQPLTVYRWEARRVTIPDAHKVRLTRLFGCEMGDLMRWDEAGALRRKEQTR